MGIAQLVERCLAMAKVAGSNPVSHSIKNGVGSKNPGSITSSML